VGSFASPTFADIDGDGDLDAFIGNSFGNTLFYRNTGSASAPSFTSESNNFGLTNVGNVASPILIDIDGDGDLEAFIGNISGSAIELAQLRSGLALTNANIIVFGNSR
jgi:hypothetical protein